MTAACRRAALGFLFVLLVASHALAQRVTVTLDPAVSQDAVTGRVFVFFGRAGEREPRLPFTNMDLVSTIDRLRRATTAR